MSVERPDATGNIPAVRRPEQGPLPVSVTVPGPTTRAANAEVSPPASPQGDISLTQTPPRDENVAPQTAQVAEPAPIENFGTSLPEHTDAHSTPPTDVSSDITPVEELAVFTAKPAVRAVAIPAAEPPKQRIKGAVPEVSDTLRGNTEILQTEKDQVILNRAHPDQKIVNLVATEIAHGLPDTWHHSENEPELYRDAGSKFSALPAESETHGHRAVVLARHLQRALEKEEPQFIAGDFDFDSIESLPALAAHTDLTTGGTQVVYKGQDTRPVNMENSDEVARVEGVKAGLESYLRRAGLESQAISISNFRIREEQESNEQHLVLVDRGEISPVVVTLRPALPEPRKSSEASSTAGSERSQRPPVPTQRRESTGAIRTRKSATPRTRRTITKPTPAEVAPEPPVTKPAAADGNPTQQRRPFTGDALIIRNLLDSGMKPIEIARARKFDLEFIYRVNERRRRYAAQDGRELPDFRKEDSLPPERRTRMSASRAKILDALARMKKEPSSAELAEAAGVPLRTAQAFMEQLRAEKAAVAPQEQAPRLSPERIEKARTVMKGLHDNYFGDQQARAATRFAVDVSRSYFFKLETQLREAKLTPDTVGGTLSEVHRDIAFDFLIAGMDYNDIRAKYAASDEINDLLFSSICSRLRGKGYLIPYPRRGPKPRTAQED